MNTKLISKMALTLALITAVGVIKPSMALANGVSPIPCHSQNYNMVLGQSDMYFTSEKLGQYISLMDSMRDYTSPADWSKYFFPIKRSSAVAQIMLNSHGPLSGTTRDAFLGLISSIDAAGEKLDGLLEIQAFFDVAVDIMTINEQLKTATK